MASVGVFGEDEEELESDEEESEDWLEHILTYAGFDESQIEDVRNKIRDCLLYTSKENLSISKVAASEMERGQTGVRALRGLSLIHILKWSR